MTTCPKCGRTVEKGLLRDNQIVLLEPSPCTYVTVDDYDFQAFPQDGARVVLSCALVVHSALCPKERQEHASVRTQGKKTYDANQHAKKGR